MPIPANERFGAIAPLPLIGNTSIALEARIIAATHRDLEAMVARASFREDLFYRLRVVEIALPALRERAGDIPILVEGLLAKINRDLGKAVRYVTPAAMARLAGHAWPGNVRELENALTRAVVPGSTPACSRSSPGSTVRPAPPCRSVCACCSTSTGPDG